MDSSHLDREEKNNSRIQKKGFFRALSRKPSNKLHNNLLTRDYSVNPTSDKYFETEHSLTLSRKRSLCNKLAKSHGDPQFGSRAKTGRTTLNAKEKVLNKYPLLSIEYPASSEYSREHILQGVNSIYAELIDMNAMIILMQYNDKMLSHRAVERFFEWIPLFSVFLERYMHVEEDLIVRWVELRADTLRGDIRPSVRMVSRGRIQKGLRDIIALQEHFRPHIPAGQVLSKLISAVHCFTIEVIDFFDKMVSKLSQLISEHYTKAEVEKNRTRIVKHLVSLVGYQDFVALYTRWMRPGQLLEWRTTVLLPCDFKFFAYTSWERDMDNAHYQIASQYGEMLDKENREDIESNKQRKEDFERAKASRKNMSAPVGMEYDDIEIEMTDEVEIHEQHDDEYE